MALIPIDTRQPPHQDIWGVLTVVNDVYARFPDRFGTLAQQKALKDFVANNTYPLDSQKFFDGFVKKLNQLELKPFADMKIAILGAHDESRSTISSAISLLYQGHFAECWDMNDSKGGARLTLKEAGGIAENSGGFDYVITGNVLNSDINTIPQDTILSCATIAKQGARIIHMLGYGEFRDRGHIDNKWLLEVAGQRHHYNVPEGKYRYLGNSSGTQMMVLEQELSLKHSPASVAFYQDYRSWQEAKAPERPLGTLQLRDVMMYFLDHPERLSVLQGHSLLTIANPHHHLAERDSIISDITKELSNRPATTLSTDDAELDGPDKGIRR